MQSKERIDQILVERGLAETRSRAQALVMAGRVYFTRNDSKRIKKAEKSGEKIPGDSMVTVDSGMPYVSRGGEKLKSLLDVHPFPLKSAVCLDVGASTGGFTDCLLREGAGEVWALDCGRNQLHERLRKDRRVKVMEKINARYLKPEDFPSLFDCITADLSFISLEKVLVQLYALLSSGGYLVLLVKPQFELSRAEVNRGVVREGDKREKAVKKITSLLSGFSGEILATVPSAVKRRKRLFRP